MNRSALLQQLNQWHNDDQYDQIVEAILQIPESERDYELKGQLARAYNNLGRYQDGLDLLLTLEQEGKQDPIWYYRTGYSYFYLHRMGKAAAAFREALRLDPEDGDTKEMLELCRCRNNRDVFKQKEQAAPEQYTSDEIKAVEDFISENFGEVESVYHEIVSPDIHLDIAMIPPSPERKFYTLCTMGMGAHAMNVPRDLREQNLARAELMIFLPPDWKLGSENEKWYWPIRLLKMLGRLPINDDTWLGWGHTIDIGSPVAPGCRLCGAILSAPCSEQGGTRLFPLPGDEEPVRCTLPGGEEVCFYQVIPLYREEMELKVGANADKLFSIFSGRLSPIVDPTRRNFAEIKEDK